MTTIDSIHLDLQTSDLSGAGTDGDVYLGIGGREFSVDTEADDFERGRSGSYTFGDGANVRNAAVNDPRTPQLTVELVDELPMYLRFQPQSRTDNWCLQRAVVFLNGSPLPQWGTSPYLTLTADLWLGTRSGLVVQLRRHSDGHEPIP